MSTVNNWMILSGVPLGCEGEDDKALPACIIDLNRRLAELRGTSPQAGFVRVDQYAGGSKALEADVFLLAESHGVEVGEMLGFITSVNWGTDTVIQVLYKGQEDRGWRQLVGLYPAEIVTLESAPLESGPLPN